MDIIKDDKYWEDKLDRRFYAEQFIWELFPDKPEDAYIEYFKEDFTELYLSYNKLSNIPALAFGKLTGLNILSLSNNNLTSIPDSIGKLSQLKILNLSHNNLTNIPDSIGNLSGLKELYLGYNNLSKQEQEKIKKLLPSTTIIF